MSSRTHVWWHTDAFALTPHRLRQKMSEKALAAKSGYERAFISLIELGKTNPSLPQRSEATLSR